MREHLDHLNDFVFYGRSRAYDAIEVFRAIIYGKAQITLKWDGAPRLFIGRDEQGPFIATKSFLSRNSIRYRSDTEIQAISDQALASKLMSVWPYVDYMCNFESGVVSGDWLFDVNTMNDGWFTPNTLTYYVPWLERLSHTVGVAWHQTVPGFRQHPCIWHAPMESEIQYMDENEIESGEAACIIFKGTIDACEYALKWLEGYPAISDLLKRYTNTVIRNADWDTYYNAVALGSGFEDYLHKHYTKRITDLKTESGRDRLRAEYGLILANIQGQPLVDIFKLYILINSFKLVLMSKFAVPQDVEVLCDGVQAQHEGFVVWVDGSPCKFVNQRRFTHENFKRDVFYK